MQRFFWFCVFLIFGTDFSAAQVSPISWLALMKWESKLLNNSNLAAKACWSSVSRGVLAREQAKICSQQLELMPHVVSAAQQTAASCQQLFSDRRWNCSSIQTAPRLTPDLTSGTREQAFVYALASAALTQTMARACASGTLLQCGCGPVPRYPPDGLFKWGGCGDDLRYGKKLSKAFMEVIQRRHKGDRNRVENNTNEKKKQTKKVMIKKPSNKVLDAVNLHNIKTGRKVAEQSMTTQCKCHGVSGSCNIKTCWRTVASPLVIGEKLKRQYSTAVEVVSRRPAPGRKLSLVAVDVTGVGRSIYNGQDLVYVTKSPDYCTKDRRVGSLGTKGRTCNASSSSYDSCSSMCCGRGYTTVTTEVVERCHCKYYWCCYVRCKTCRKIVDVNKCL